MANYTLKPGIIHIGKDAISPFVHTSTVILDKNTRLDKVLSDAYNKYHDRNKPQIESTDFIQQDSNWEYDEERNLYKTYIGKIQNEKYAEYDIICSVHPSLKTIIGLVNNSEYKFLMAEIVQNDIWLVCNVQPDIQLEVNLYFNLIYKTSIERDTPKNLKVPLDKNRFKKLSEDEHIYTIEVPELMGCTYYISCTFDLENMQKFLSTNNRYILADHIENVVTIRTEFPFSGEVILIPYIY